MLEDITEARETLPKTGLCIYTHCKVEIVFARCFSIARGRDWPNHERNGGILVSSTINNKQQMDRTKQQTSDVPAAEML